MAFLPIKRNWSLSCYDNLVNYLQVLRCALEKIECILHCRDGLKVWRAFLFKRAIGFEGTVGAIDAKYYNNILEEWLIISAYDVMEEFEFY